MSKPSSGHFKGTTGAKNAHNNIMSNRSPYDIIASRTSGLDLREHPTKYKQLSSKKLKEFNEKEKNRTLTKEEYKRREFHKRLTIRRRDSINEFWDQEYYRVKHKLPTTRKWTDEQRKAIENHQRPKFNGQTLHSHHTYSVAKYPHLANIGAIIYPATPKEHRQGWHGGNPRNSLPGRPIKNVKDF